MAYLEDDLTNEFLAEGRELLDKVDQELVALEREPGSATRIASIFRAIHTIKGTAVCLGFSRLAWLAHAGENVLGRLRDGELVVDAAIVGALLDMADAVRGMLVEISRTRVESDDDHRPLVARLERFAQAPRVGMATLTAVTAVQAAPLVAPANFSAAREAALPETSVRVDLRMLDQALHLSHDFSETLALLKEELPTRRPPSLQAALDRLDAIALELADTMRKTRMQPIGALWLSFPRIVRDLALGCGKRAQLETDGNRVELDRTVIEAIRDPLTHLVRNAIDHGIETPEVRVARGKEPVGVVGLGAKRAGGYIHITVSDDGGGIDFVKVTRKALQRGLIATDSAGQLSEAEALDLIFLPGFTTAEQVTQVSGRGVGLDVVRTNVQRAGGVVEVKSEVGKGTTVKLKFPDVTRKR